METAERARGTIALALLVLFCLASYGGTYGWARTSGRLASYSACDSIWPCPISILGTPGWRLTFAPAIEIETRVRLLLER